MALSYIVNSIWTIFFAWMPLGLQIAFGALVAISILVLLFKVIALILGAIPFL